MHQPAAVCALKGACTGLMFLCSREQRPAMGAGEMNGQFGHVHPDSMRVNLRDAYISVTEALNHGGIHHGAEVLIDWVASDDLGGDATERALGAADGILIPGGFGIRGVEGKVDAVRFARAMREDPPGR